jgi:hypothetical protein
VQGFGGKTRRKETTGKPRRSWELEIRIGSIEWIQLAEDGDRWRALVNTVMDLRVLAPRS